ncbi:MAG TPA: hypothetical protein VJN63_04240 [Thermoplasmata archaeon]|nr:hypothetical protein [Thermoplasmata archaeon]
MGYPPPVGPYVPPPTPGQMAGYAAAQAKRRNRTGGSWLVGAAVLHVITIPVALFLLKAFVEFQVGRSVSWGELFNAFAATGGMPLILAGVFAQLTFAFFAGVGAVLLSRQVAGVAVAMVVVGIVAVIFSFAIFGGIVGALGGFLSIAGGATAWPRTPAYPFPPPIAAWPPPGPPRP